jgi:hypothetical protein
MNHLTTLFSERLSINWDPIQHRTRCSGRQINLASQVLMSASSKEAVAATVLLNKAGSGKLRPSLLHV